MFKDCASFNHSLAGFDVRQLEKANFMFEDAISFNQPLGSWDTSNMISVNKMFKGASSFDQNITSWDTSSMTDISYLFSSTVFNQPLNNWDISRVSTLKAIFEYNQVFNQPLDQWNTSSVVNFVRVFRDAEKFNQDISTWVTSMGTSMEYMFRDAADFNQPLGLWDVGSVTSILRIFENGIFDQDLSSWDLSLVSTFSYCDRMDNAGCNPARLFELGCVSYCECTEVAHSTQYHDENSLHLERDASEEVTCDVGFSGGGSAVCLHNGSVSTTTCHSLDCGAPEQTFPINFTFANGTSSRYANRAVQCAAGFWGSPFPSNVTCLYEGIWSGVDNCTDVNECLDPSVCSHGGQCLNVLGSFMCLPQVRSVTPTVLSSMSGQDVLQVELLFEPGLSSVTDFSELQDLYSLNWTYGLAQYEVELATLLSYNHTTGLALAELTTIAGCPALQSLIPVIVYMQKAIFVVLSDPVR